MNTLLVISLQDAWEFIATYWLLLAFIGAVSMKIISMHFSILSLRKGSIAMIHSKLDTHNKKLEELEVLDTKTEIKLTDLINRNKTATEDTAKSLKSDMDSSVKFMQNQLTEVGKDVAVIKNNLNLLMNNKIKMEVE